MGHLILIGALLLSIWLIRADSLRRTGISLALWIPTLWAGILCSRPVSVWFGANMADLDPSYSLEGSPADRYFYLGMIIAAMVVLSKRRIGWQAVISKNWPLFLLYFYLLITVLWADSSMVSLKRWIKEVGNFAMVLVILTESNPQEAFRAVFIRCAYLLFPLSIVFIRYFPDLGRIYNFHSGQIQAIGVTLQKNSLGGMALVCALVLVWEWLNFENIPRHTDPKRHPSRVQRSWLERYAPPLFLGLGIWLLRISDSKTSIACLVLAGTILASARFPVFQRRIRAAGVYLLAGIVFWFLLDSAFDLTSKLVVFMGRDPTLTGRTDVWRELLALNTNPIFGTGFCSFWSDPHFRARLPEWVAASAHNGYLEVYLDGGLLALFFLGLLLFTSATRINRQLGHSGNYALVKLTILLVVIIANYSESNFGRMTPLGFAFLLVAAEVPSRKRTIEASRSARIRNSNTNWPSPAGIAPLRA